jgi:hypothetical protein
MILANTLVFEIPVTPKDYYRKSIKTSQTEDLFRISSKPTQSRIITYIQLSISRDRVNIDDNQ